MYNVELSNADSFIAFGTNPSSWPTCSSPEFTGRAGACSCADGYIGSVVYVNGAPSGCNLPNAAPTSSAPPTTTTTTTTRVCAAGSYQLNGGCAPCPVGSYCVVFDTFVEDVPEDVFNNRPWAPGDNPKTAVWEYLKTHPEFQIDKSIQNKLLITVAPDGYLKRVS